MDDDASTTPTQRLDRVDEQLRRARDDLADSRPEVAGLLDDALADVEEALDRLRAEQRRLDGDLDTLFDALGDADCRAILLATDEPRTARELIDRCRIPRSTVYRKLARLTEAGLLEETVRVSASGNHPAAYVRRVDRLWIPANEMQVFQVAISSRDAPRSGRSVDTRQRIDAGSTAAPDVDATAQNGAASEHAEPVPNPLGTGAPDASRWLSAWGWPDRPLSD